MTLDREHELGEIAVADDPPELLLGDEHPRSGPALAHVTFLPAFHVALRVPDDLDHALARVRRAQRLGELPVDPESHQRQRVLESFAQ